MAKGPEVPSVAGKDPDRRSDTGVDPADPQHRTTIEARGRGIRTDAAFLLTGLNPRLDLANPVALAVCDTGRASISSASSSRKRAGPGALEKALSFDEG